MRSLIERIRRRVTGEALLEWYFGLTGAAAVLMFIRKLGVFELTVKEFYLGLAVVFMLFLSWMATGFLLIIDKRLRDLQAKMG